jgi:hypothetical protein
MVRPRSFLLTFHEPGSGVLEDLSSDRQRVRVTDVEDVAGYLAVWLEGWCGPAANAGGRQGSTIREHDR